MAKYKKRVPKSNKRYLNHGGQHGADGNPIIEQNPFGSGSNYLGEDSNSGVYSNPDDESERSGPSAGQYAAAGTALAAGSANSYKTFQDPNSSIRDKSTSFDGAVTGTASAINPLVGSVIGVANSFGAGRRDKNEAMTEGTAGAPPKLVDEKSARRGAIVGSWFSPSKAIATRGSYEGGFTDFTGKGYTAALNKEAKDAWDLANPKVVVDNKDYAQDTVYQEMNNLSQQRMGGKMYGHGGMLTRYDGGFKHDDMNAANVNNGIPLDDKNVVEKGETEANKFIYSDTLKDGKHTYSALSKKIDKKFIRPGDKMEAEQKKLELAKLAEKQEMHKEKIVSRAYKKAYGKDFNQEQMNYSANGGYLGEQKVVNQPQKNFPFYQEQDGRYFTGNMMMTPEAFQTADRSGNQRLPYKSEITADEYNKYIGTTNMFQPYRTKEYQQKVPFEFGGGLTGPPIPVKDSLYIENKIKTDPYLSARYKYNVENTRRDGDILWRDNGMGGKPTKVPFTGMKEVDRLAYKHKIDQDLIDQGKEPIYNVFQNNIAPQRNMGGKRYYRPGGPLNYDKNGNLIGDNGGYSTPEGTFDSQGNQLTNPYGEYSTGSDANNQAYARYKSDLGEPIGSWSDMDYRGKQAEQLAQNQSQQTPGVKTAEELLSSTSQGTPGLFGNSKDGNNSGRGFNSNNFLDSAGNFIGPLNDIYRGSQTSPVNYERVTPELIKPELVNYEASRNLQRRDIGEGFRNTQEQLRNINNPAEYRASLIQTAGQRDKLMSDSTAKSYENELNTNSTIRSRANEFNAGAKNQGKYFNASTQRAEADARQQEIDIAGNTKSTGLYNLGMAISQRASDKNYTEQDNVAIDAISQKYPGWSWDKKQNKWKNKSGKTKSMNELLTDKPE